MPKFYHVDRVGNKLQAGQIITLIHSRSTIKEQTDNAVVYTSMFPEGVTQHGWRYLLNTNRQQPSKDQDGMIEVLAEFIRRSDYPSRPSRFQSLFAWKAFEDAERFISFSPVTVDGEKGYQGDIWLVESDNVAFESDMKLLNLGNSWIDAITNMHLYWNGQINQEPLIEVLLKPPVYVVQKLHL